MFDPLIEHLHLCCVQVLGERPGCGFYIAPDLIVTCAHVVGSKAPGSDINLRKWSSVGVEMLPPARVLFLFRDDDIAFLQSAGPGEAVAALGADVRLRDPLVAVGFPRREDREERDHFEATYEGQTLFLAASGRAGIEEKFKGGQVEPGFSGGPLLNLRTKRVMGVVVATRDKRNDLGGWAIDIEVVAKRLNLDLPVPTADWLRAASGQVLPTSYPDTSRSNSSAVDKQ